MKNWIYKGDINLEHGGAWYNTEGLSMDSDYCEIVKVTDLESACGAEGHYLIERGSIYIPLEREKRVSALGCCGYKLSACGLQVIDCTGEAQSGLEAALMLADAFDAYHGIEPDVFGGREVVKLAGYPDSTEGDYDTFTRCKSIASYVKREYGLRAA
jgi:hypothetical protein